MIIQFLFGMFAWGCLHISVRAFITQRIAISKERAWTGYTTFVLSIPLFLAGLSSTAVLVYTIKM